MEYLNILIMHSTTKATKWAAQYARPAGYNIAITFCIGYRVLADIIYICGGSSCCTFEI